MPVAKVGLAQWPKLTRGDHVVVLCWLFWVDFMSISALGSVGITLSVEAGFTAKEAPVNLSGSHEEASTT